MDANDARLAGSWFMDVQSHIDGGFQARIRDPVEY